MKKVSIIYNCGTLAYDETKKQFTGYIDGQYFTLKQGKDRKWYASKTLNSTIFEKEQKIKESNNENDIGF